MTTIDGFHDYGSAPTSPHWTTEDEVNQVRAHALVRIEGFGASQAQAEAFLDENDLTVVRGQRDDEVKAAVEAFIAKFNAEAESDDEREAREQAEADAAEAASTALADATELVKSEGFDVTDHSVKDVKSYVADNAALAKVVLDAERAADEPRKSLVEWLEKLAAPYADAVGEPDADGAAGQSDAEAAE